MTEPEAAPVRSGAILPVLLLVLLALTALATMALRIAHREMIVTRATHDLVHARLAAEGALRIAVEEETPARLRALLPDTALADTATVIVEGEHPGGVRFRLLAHRLREDFFLLEGVGAPRGGEGGEARSGRVVWVLDPAGTLASFSAAVEHGGTLSGGTPEGDEASCPPAGWAETHCSPFRTTLDSLFPTGQITPATRVGTTDGPVLGILTLDPLLALADRRPEGVLSPAPESSVGICAIDSPSNWGSPSDPGGPCGLHRPLIVSPGSLELSKGEGQGVLVVAGDLEMRGGMRFAGLVLVGGDITLSDGAFVEGLVRSGGDVHLSGDSRVRASGCAVLHALAENPAGDRVFPLPGRSWVGPL